jgi:hypothetical protein
MKGSLRNMPPFAICRCGAPLCGVYHCIVSGHYFTDCNATPGGRDGDGEKGRMNVEEIKEWVRDMRLCYFREIRHAVAAKLDALAQKEPKP